MAEQSSRFAGGARRTGAVGAALAIAVLGAVGCGSDSSGNDVSNAIQSVQGGLSTAQGALSTAQQKAGTISTQVQSVQSQVQSVQSQISTSKSGGGYGY